MQDLHKMARDIINREGGYVDDPADPGGATKYGISLRALESLGDDINADGAINRADIRALTPKDAEKIYIQHYYRRPKINHLPSAIQPCLFDSYVHMGARAVKILQEICTKIGRDIKIDGIIGPETIKTVREFMQIDAVLFLDSYAIERRQFYFNLGRARPQFRKYIRAKNGEKGGWITRAESFLSPRYHLTSDEFEMELAKWV